MEDLYDGEIEETKITTSEKKEHSEELPLKWKEALTQIDYGFDVKTSTILLFGDIADGTLYDLILRIRAIMHMRPEENKNDPINLVINSDGGDVYEALGMIDYIQSLDVKVNTICRGRAMSAAALLLCSETGVRAASKHSTIMFHELSTGLYGKSSDMKANARHMEKLEDILLTIMTENSNKDKKFWSDATIKDYYLSPEDAVNHGVIDKVISSKNERR